MAYKVVMPYHLHMPSYFLETFTEYPCLFRTVAILNISEESDNTKQMYSDSSPAMTK